MHFIRFARLIIGIVLLMAGFLTEADGSDIDTFVKQQGDELLTLRNIEKPVRKGNFVPVPIPISNPTIGTGLALGLLYLHPEKQGISNPKPATSGIGVMYTNTDSWFTGIFHDNNWFDDRLRLTAFIGTGELNLKYYGVGPDSIFQNRPLAYNIEPDGLYGQVLFEPLKSTGWYAGIRYLYTYANVTFKASELLDFLPDLKGNLTTSSLGVAVIYDTRDNSYYPSNGSYFEAAIMLDDPAWSSDFDFTKYTTAYNHYFSITDTVVLAVRADLGLVTGNVPFYMLPSLNLRGIATGRYSDEAIVSGHVEWRHKFLPRWGYILSYESGFTHNSLDGIFDGRYAYSVGAGLRWQVLSSEKLHLGLDFGINEDDQSVCVQVGERF